MPSGREVFIRSGGYFSFPSELFEAWAGAEDGGIGGALVLNLFRRLSMRCLWIL